MTLADKIGICLMLLAYLVLQNVVIVPKYEHKELIGPANADGFVPEYKEPEDLYVDPIEAGWISGKS